VPRLQVGGHKVPLGIPAADSYWQGVKAAIPLRRVGSAEDAAGAILMLAGPWASYVTGQVLEVIGGAYM
jgi:3-oxoacyl-[acyl-carrier protein] reductase